MYLSRPARGKVPEYPRPVPTIDLEDIPICDDTIVYEEWTDDAEREAEERAEKRQKRRQDVAESYLRGGEIMILTASLKGPFEGWENPWAKKKQRTGGLEVPETTAKIALSGLPQAEHIAKTSARGHISLQADDPIPHDAQTAELAPRNPFGAKDRATNGTLEGHGPSSTKRVEDWLKTSDVYSRRSKSHLGSSPTPATRLKTRDQMCPQPRSSPIRTKPGHDDAKAQTLVSEARIEPPISRPGTASSAPTQESPRRAEAAILESKRRSLHTLPPSTNLPEFEFRRGRQARKKSPGDGQSPHAIIIPNDLSRAEPLAQPHTDSGVPPEGSKSRDTSKPRPLLSTETSKTSTVQHIPSAQAVAAPNPEPAASNAQSTNEILHELPSTTRSRVNLQQHAIPKALAAHQQIPEPITVQVRRTQGVEGPDQVCPPPTADDTPMRELETQEMIAAIKPLDFSTIKKPTFDLIRLQSPATATKVMPTKKPKRASFAVEHPASDESQRSIKAGMKVKKVTVSEIAQQEKETSKVTLFEETPISSTSVHDAIHHELLHESLPSLSSMFGDRKASAPKSILKSSNAISSAPAGSGHTASTSIKQDAQIPSGQAGQNHIRGDVVDEDDNFDLDAAIDDLGSYLGTWDADEEAGKMAAVK